MLRLLYRLVGGRHSDSNRCLIRTNLVMLGRPTISQIIIASDVKEVLVMHRGKSNVWKSVIS